MSQTTEAVRELWVMSRQAEQACEADAETLGHMAEALSDIVAMWPIEEERAEEYDAATGRLLSGVASLTRRTSEEGKTLPIDFAVSRLMTDWSHTSLYDVAKTAALQYVDNRVADGSRVSTKQVAEDIVDFVEIVGGSKLYHTKTGAMREFAQFLGRQDSTRDTISYDASPRDAYLEEIVSKLGTRQARRLLRTAAATGGVTAGAIVLYKKVFAS